MPEKSGQKNAGIPLIETKLYMPRWRSGLISRPRLIERMNQGMNGKLTLVAAPAGFGKSTLLAEWIAALNAPENTVAWVSLDSNDNDAVFFWTYFIKALQKIYPDVGENALLLLQAPQPAAIETILTSLINEVNTGKEEYIIILDDYHLIDAAEIHQGMVFLLDHLPAQMHLMLSSRVDPPVPLSRLRAKGELLELRSGDLRFTTDEVNDFFRQSMGLTLAEDGITALTTRTEGWIAGLQLAGLSLQGREDVAGFINTFSGDDRYILDYLVEEVLLRQPEDIRQFLLQTAILGRLSVPLCNVVADRENSKTLLEILERENLFIIPLDDKRQWYRYHHLFADMLRARLETEYPDLPAKLHLRACDWYEAQNESAAAIHHATAAGDFQRVAGLVELAAPVMFSTAHSSTLYGWLRKIPEEIILKRPVLSIWAAWAAMDTRDLAAGERWLLNAEKYLSGNDAENMIFTDEKQFDTLPALIATARAFYAQASNDADATISYAREALAILPEEEYVWRGGATALLGLASWSRGDLQAAYESFAGGLGLIEGAGIPHYKISGTHVLADICIGQGRLRDAIDLYQQSMKLAESWRGAVIRGTADLCLGLAELYNEQNAQDKARDWLARGQAFGADAALTENQYRWLVLQSQMAEDENRLDDAITLLAEANEVFVPDAVPSVRPVAALQAQLWIKTGKIADAERWAAQKDLAVNDEVTFLREFEHITLAKLYIAQYAAKRDDRQLDAAIALLDRLLQASEANERTGSTIEIMIQQALAYQAEGDVSLALVPLERALALAAPEGYVRTFRKEGVKMRDLLRQAAAAGISGKYTRRLLAAFDAGPSPGKPAVNVAADALAEPLTNREIEILRLIAAGMRNQEIADQLFISLYTVKRHIANAYGKMEVSTRTEAVARANELKLL